MYRVSECMQWNDSCTYCSTMMEMATARRAATRDRATPSAITVGVWSVDEAVEGDAVGTDGQELWVQSFH